MNRRTFEGDLSLLLTKFGRVTIARTKHEEGSDAPAFPAIRDCVDSGHLVVVAETALDGSEGVCLTSHLRWAVQTLADQARHGAAP